MNSFLDSSVAHLRTFFKSSIQHFELPSGGLFRVSGLSQMEMEVLVWFIKLLKGNDEEAEVGNRPCSASPSSLKAGSRKLRSVVVLTVEGQEPLMGDA